jgi:hypothetical protein
MKKNFEIKLINRGMVDTAKYRYRFLAGCSNVKNLEKWQIKRISINAIGTTAALSDKSDTNPNGWEIVKEGL